MTAQLPETINKEIIDKINALLQRSTFIDEGNLSFRAILRDLSKLMKANPFEAHLAYAAAYQLSGNIDKVLDHLRIASEIGDKRIVKSGKSVFLSNLGYFSDAQMLYAESSDPEYGELEKYLDLAYSTFSFTTLTKWFKKAEKMHLDTSSMDTQTSIRAQSILDKANVSQETIAELANTAGDVLRENHLFTLGKTEFHIEDESSSDPCIYVTFRVGTSEEKAAELYDDFVTRLVTKYEYIPEVIHFSFRAAA